MTDLQEPTPDIRPADTAKPGNRMALGIVVILMLITWLLVMSFRWELRAKYWAGQAMQSETREDRDFYVTRLASIRDKSLNAVSPMMDNPNPEIRDAAVTILRYCESKQAASMLVSMLSDSNHDIAAAAATTLARRTDAASYVPQLATILQGDSELASWGAAVAIGRIGGHDAEQVLLNAISGPLDPDLKSQILDSLGMMECESAVLHMIDALGDDRPVRLLPQSQQSAHRALATLGPQLLARGADPNSAMQATSTAPTVAAIAARWIRLLTKHDAEPIATQPAERRAESIRELKNAWLKKQTTKPEQ